jgi:outer membrane protein TolC
MSHVLRHCQIVLAAMVFLTPPMSVFAQSGQSAGAAAVSAVQAPAAARRLSVEDAVKLALEQNLGIQIERVNPQIQDLAIAQTRALWTPTLTTDLSNTARDNAVTNAFAGGQNKVTTSTFASAFGVSQLLPTGGNYSLAWDNQRLTSTNFFSTFDPQLASTLTLVATQPLVRNFKIDNVRQQLQTNSKLREASDLQLRSAIVGTTRNVKNAYWELAYQIASLNAAQQSLDLAKRVLGDNEKRVQIGTMAPIDIVEAQAEVARNEESVIVAEALIERAEDNLRALIFDPSAPDFWTTSIEPSDAAPFQAQTIDAEAAVRRALDNRLDLKQAQNGLERNDINIRYLRNQVLPEVNANVTYGMTGVGGVRYAQDLSAITTGGIPTRTLLSSRGFGSVLGDVFGFDLPTWTVGVSVGYPIGTSTSEANLARARLEYSQAQTQLRNLELQIATQVRDLARQVQTNQKRVDTTRASRELAERRLEAAEKKFAAGIETSFFVFQAQRDLSQARTNEVRAISDYNKSLVDFEAVQEAPLSGGIGSTAGGIGGTAGAGIPAIR